MENSKSLNGNILIRLLKTISAGEWSAFEKFAGSPYFNEGRNYMPLLKILKKHHPEFNSSDFTKEKIYNKLYPGKQFKESVLNSMFSRLYKIGEDYLIYSAVNKDKTMLKERLIIKELRSRGVMLKLNRQIDEKLNFLLRKNFSSNDFKSLYQIQSELNKLVQVSNKTENFYRSIYSLIKYSLYFFLFEVSLKFSSVYSLKNYWNEDFTASYLSKIFEAIDFNKILAIIEKEDYKNYVPIKLCYLSYLATRYPDNDGYYHQMKTLYLKESENLDDDFRITILTNLTAICSMKLVLGKSSFKHEAFELKKIFIEKNMFFHSDDYIKIGDFRSAFLDAVNVGDLEWAENFLEKYLHRVHPDFRDNAYHFCKAWLSYYAGMHDQALEHVSKVNVNQITFKLDLKNITARVYYDTDSTEPLYSLLDSYYQLIVNSGSKNKEYLSRHKRFIKYLRMLLKIKNGSNNQTELSLLKKKLSEESVTGKSWLISKTESS